MATTPRWEWRTFGTTFRGADKTIWNAATSSRSIRDTYFLSDDSDAAIKLRDQALIVKIPAKVDAAGLELWLPTSQGAFPLDHEALATIFAVWKLPVPQLRRSAYDRTMFVSEIVAPHSALTVVGVRKERRDGQIDGCLVEVADVWFDGYPLRSVAVEMDDPAQVRRTVQALGLGPYENVNYVKALRRHVSVRGPKRRNAA